MRLTSFSDDSLRVPMYVGDHDGRHGTVGELAASYAVADKHLVKGGP